MGRRFFVGWQQLSGRSIARQFGEAQQWAPTQFGEVVLGDVRRNRRVVCLVVGWGRVSRA